MRDERKRLNTVADSKQFLEESKHSDYSGVKQTNLAEIDEDDHYKPVQVEGVNADDLVEQSGQGPVISVKQNNHSIIKEMVEEEND